MQLIEEKFEASMEQAIECVREVIAHDLDMYTAHSGAKRWRTWRSI